MKNHKTARVLIASAAMLLAGGCMSNVPTGIEAPAVRTSISLATHEDSLSQGGSTFNVQSGKVILTGTVD